MQNIEAFIAYLKNERRYSTHTLAAYSNDIRQFNEFAKERYLISSEAEVNAPVVKSWIYECMNRKLSPRTVNRKITSLNTFYTYLLRTKILEKNPLAAISGIKTPKMLYQWVEEKDINRLLDDTAFGNDFQGIRNKLMIELLYGTGIRRAELIGLQLSDVDTRNKILKVLGKRNKERIIPIPQLLVSTLEDYLKARKFMGFDHANLVLTNDGGPVYPMFVQRIVKNLVASVSPVSKTSPHVLRHSYATHLMNHGADINAIKELLGHSSLAATQIYTHNSIERLKTIYKQSHPKS